MLFVARLGEAWPGKDKFTDCHDPRTYRQPDTGSDFVMTRRKGPFRNNYVVNDILHPLLRKLGMKQCGMHAFRHGRVSVLVKMRVPREVIREWIGHGSDEMINVYLHLEDEWQNEALNQVPSMIPSTILGKSPSNPLLIM